MPITVTSRDSALTVALYGEIDHHAARELMAQMVANDRQTRRYSALRTRLLRETGQEG